MVRVNIIRISETVFPCFLCPTAEAGVKNRIQDSVPLPDFIPVISLLKNQSYSATLTAITSCVYKKKISTEKGCEG